MDRGDQPPGGRVLTIRQQLRKHREPQSKRKRSQYLEWLDEWDDEGNLSALDNIHKFHEEVEKKRKSLAEKYKYRFIPPDTVLVQTFLMKYINGDVVPLKERFYEEDFYSYNPSTIHATFENDQHNRLWYFLARKHEEHEEPVRVFPGGCWKQFGESQVIVCDDSTVGYKKAFLSYEGDTECGKRTFWQLAEYSIVDEDITRSTPGTSNSVANGNTKVYDKVICRMMARD